MIPGTRYSSLEAHGLRTRYSPKSRIGQGLVSAAPWINVLLLIVLFALIESRLALQPGVVVDLPRAPFHEGTPASGPVAVILSVSGIQPGTRENVVFFDDERFLMSNARQMENLKKAMAERMRRQSDATLIIQSDRRVPHGSVVAIVNLAMDAGALRVNMATRPL